MDVSDIKKSALDDIKSAKTPEDIEKIRIKYLGRKGELTAVLRSLKDLSIEERRKIGPEVQELKRELENLLDNLRSSAKGGSASDGKSSIDLTAPGKKQERGHLHILAQVERDIRKIFLSMNFSVVDGLEVETEHYNFDALNIPSNHPARDMWDTFWIKSSQIKRESVREYSRKNISDGLDRLLLRTHTSPMQVRYMEKNEPPFQIIVPGRVFRYEAIDATHEINFYQLEGLMVGKNITLANFKFVIEEFFKRFFDGQKIEFRYRPSYFPFTEPSVEVDVKVGGKWLEMMGAGMVHPRVFEYAHYNPRDWQGFAFGVGIDRLAMIKYKIPDIRLFYSGDLRFIRQF
jgi:phenylalanyl-tRNA synthetase alpha chain